MAFITQESDELCEPASTWPATRGGREKGGLLDLLAFALSGPALDGSHSSSIRYFVIYLISGCHIPMAPILSFQ